MKVVEANLAELDEERSRTEDLLRQHAEAAPIQAERDAVTKELEEARAARDAALNERQVLVATRGFQAFTDTLGEATKAMAESLYQKGALPAPLKREFVDKLLDEGACICGTPLAEHTESWEHVKEWRQRAGLQAVETAWQRVSGQIAPLADAREGLREALATLMNRIGDRARARGTSGGPKSELDGKLKDNRMEDVQDLETKRHRPGGPDRASRTSARAPSRPSC